MTIEMPETNDAAVVAVCPCGEIDLYSFEDFASVVFDLIVPGVKAIILDFEKATYLDSAGTGAVIRIFKRTKASRINLRLTGLANGPRRVLAMVNLLSVIPEYPSLEAALAAEGVPPCSSAVN